MDINSLDYDVAVVGAGINGLCTAYSLASIPTLKVLVLEQYDLQHEEGSSHSQIRITRAAYPDPIYVLMANYVKNFEWPQLEKELNEKLVYDNDFIIFGHDKIYQQYKKLALDLKLPTLRLISG